MAPACAPGPAWRALRGAWLCAGLLGLAMCVLSAGVHAQAAVSRAEPAPPAASAYVPRDEYDRLQYLGRSDPEGVIPGYKALLARLAPKDPQRVVTLMALASRHNVLSHGDEVEAVARELDALAETQPLARPAAMMVRGSWLVYHSELSRAERQFIEASALIGPDAPLRMRVQILLSQADARARSGHIDDAMRRLQDAQRMIDAEGIPWRKMSIRDQIIGLLLNSQQYDKVMEATKELERMAREHGDEVILNSVYTSRAFVLSEAGTDNAATLAAWRAAIEHARRAGDRRSEALGLANIADYYLHRGEYQTTYEMSARALAMARELKEESSQVVALANMGESLIAMHRKEEGMALLRESQAIDARSGSLSSQADSAHEMGEYLEKAGYLEDAVQAYRQWRQLASELNQQDRQRALIELQEGFANEQRQHELDLLARDGRIKDEQLLNHELRVRQWTAAGILTLLLVTVVALLARRLRQRNLLLKLSNEELRIQAERDPLTGLANRHFLQSVMAARPAERGLEGTLYLLDVDHFKHINDQCGHAGGDAVLVEIAQRLRATLRDDDLIVRWGGEEFLVLVRPMPAHEADGLAQRLMCALAETPVRFEGKAVPVSASIGYGNFPLAGVEGPVNWERAIALVDTAMYLSKARGRNCACGIQRVDTTSAQSLDLLAQTLETAWHEGRVEIHLQHGPTLTGLTGTFSRPAPAAQEVPA